MQEKHDAVVRAFCDAYRLEPKRMSGSLYALTRGEQLVGMAQVRLSKADRDEVPMHLSVCQALRDHAISGLRVRLLFALPSGVYAQPIDFKGSVVGDKFVPESDGFNGGRLALVERTDGWMPVVMFPVAGMTRVCDSDPVWFEEAA